MRNDEAISYLRAKYKIASVTSLPRNDNNRLFKQMTNKLPKISIVTPVFNGVNFIESCLVSVIGQDYPNLEYIVIDGGSSDGTVEIIEKYADYLAYFVSEKDRGQTHALNKGFAKATGDVLAWLNADEEYLPGTLKKVGKAFAASPELDLFYGQRIVVDADGNEIGRKKYPPIKPFHYMLYGMRVLPTDATFWSRRVHEATGTLDEEHFPHLAMDSDWLLRLSPHVRHWRRTTDYLSKFTEHSRRATNVENVEEREKMGKYMRRRVIESLNISPIRLSVGWFLTCFYLRLFEGKMFQLPHILTSFQTLRTHVLQIGS
jgi:glycosyltransferase involved in cell wall biosynthesis